MLGGLTSIVDLEFGPDGRLYVVELDALGWLAIEVLGGTAVAGGVVKACDVDTGVCETVADGLSLPLALAFDATGVPWVAENEALGGAASIHPDVATSDSIVSRRSRAEATGAPPREHVLSLSAPIALVGIRSLGAVS